MEVKAGGASRHSDGANLLSGNQCLPDFSGWERI